MKPVSSRIRGLRAALGAAAFVATAASASETFNATAEFESERTLGTNRVAFTLIVDRTTTEEEAAHLRTLLAEGGQERVRAVLRGRADGRARLGALEIGVNLIVARPTDDGTRFYVVTERALSASTEPGTADRDFPFGVLVFDVNDRGSGEGTFHAAAALTLDEEGQVIAVDRREPGRLLDVERQD